MKIPNIKCHFRNEHVKTYANFGGFMRALDKREYQDAVRDLVSFCQMDTHFPNGEEDYAVIEDYVSQTANRYGYEEGWKMLLALRFFWNSWAYHTNASSIRFPGPVRSAGYCLRKACQRKRAA